MNENLLDVLLYLFENFSLPEAADTRHIRDDLDDAGFFPEEIADAFAWIRAGTANGRALTGTPGAHAMRVYCDAECRVLDAACRGYLVELQEYGVLSASARELVIDRLLALAEDEAEAITVDQVKWVVMMVLSSNGEDLGYARMEAIVHADAPGASH